MKRRKRINECNGVWDNMMGVVEDKDDDDDEMSHGALPPVDLSDLEDETLPITSALTKVSVLFCDIES